MTKPDETKSKEELLKKVKVRNPELAGLIELIFSRTDLQFLTVFIKTLLKNKKNEQACEHHFELIARCSKCGVIKEEEEELTVEQIEKALIDLEKMGYVERVVKK